MYRENIRRLVEQGAPAPPAHDFEDAGFYPMDPDLPLAGAWKQASVRWEEPPDA